MRFALSSLFLPFSLAPALSRWEMGNHPLRIENARAAVFAAINRQPATAQPPFPLLAGESQGEGKPFKRLPSSVILVACAFVLIGLGCGRNGGTIQHGRMSYNATEVFGEGTLALALAKAAAKGDTKAIERLVAEGANVNTVGKHEITPLWWAAWAENYEGFAALLEKGADPNAQRAEGYPIMYLISRLEDSRFLQAALKHGGDPNLRDKQSSETPLFVAVKRGFKKHVDLLLAAKADVTARLEISGESLPMVAIASGSDYDVAYRFLQLGADPSVKAAGDMTLADVIETVSVNSLNPSNPWRAKVIEFMRAKGITVRETARK